RLARVCGQPQYTALRLSTLHGMLNGVLQQRPPDTPALEFWQHTQPVQPPLLFTQLGQRDRADNAILKAGNVIVATQLGIVARLGDEPPDLGAIRLLLLPDGNLGVQHSDVVPGSVAYSRRPRSPPPREPPPRLPPRPPRSPRSPPRPPRSPPPREPPPRLPPRSRSRASSGVQSSRTA